MELVALAEERLDRLRGEVTMAGADIDQERTGGADGAGYRTVQPFIKKAADDMLDFGTVGRVRRRRHDGRKLEQH
jgi:hypothetical protein